MFSLKRVVFRAASAPSAPILAVNRQTGVSAFQRRFYGREEDGMGAYNQNRDNYQSSGRRNFQNNDRQGGFQNSGRQGGMRDNDREGSFRFPRGEGASQAYSDSAKRPNATPKETIYVGNLFFEVKAEDLKNLFAQYGNVLEARLIADARGMSRGFGYVRFDSVDAARAAIGAMHMQVYEGRRLSCNFAQTNFSAITDEKPVATPTRTLYIGNIPFEMTDRELNDVFKDMNNLIDVRVAVDRRTGQPRGFCHAEFVDVESAQAAYETLTGLAPYGRKLRLDYSNSAPGRLERYLAEKGGAAAAEGAQGDQLASTQAEAAEPTESQTESGETSTTNTPNY